MVERAASRRGAGEHLDLRRCRILICNDDGVEAPGIKLLTRVAKRFSSDVWVVAPEQEQSGASHSLTLHRPLRVRKLGPRRFAVDGTPTDCVLLAVNALLQDKRPDLVLSGVNGGGNLGEDVTYSGTVAAAMEASLLGFRAIALSQHIAEDGKINWAIAESWAGKVIRRLAALPWQRDTLYNVNFPDVAPRAVKGVVAAAQGGRKIGDHLLARVDPRGRPYYWIGPQRDEEHAPAGSDVRCVAAGYVTVTPIFLDLTHRKALAKLKKALA
jgi:5'-nucleotidase